MCRGGTEQGFFKIILCVRGLGCKILLILMRGNFDRIRTSCVLETVDSGHMATPLWRRSPRVHRGRDDVNPWTWSEEGNFEASDAVTDNDGVQDGSSRGRGRGGIGANPNAVVVSTRRWPATRKHHRADSRLGRVLGTTHSGLAQYVHGPLLNAKRAWLKQARAQEYKERLEAKERKEAEARLEAEDYELRA